MSGSRFNSALAAFRAARRSRGLAVVYRLASQPALSVALTVVAGKTRTFTEDANGVGVSGQERDFLIEAAELAIGGQRRVPAPGDRIELTVPADLDPAQPVWVYEVAPLAGGKHVEPVGDLGPVLRVHTTHSETRERE